jgi:hypothetical protein
VQQYLGMENTPVSSHHQRQGLSRQAKVFVLPVWK